MKKTFFFLFLLMAMLCAYENTMAQNIHIRGVVRTNKPKDSIDKISILVKGTTNGTITSPDGSFQLNVSSLPVTLVISFIGFETQEVTVNKADQSVVVELVQTAVMGDEIVVSATKFPTRIIESPVSIEKFTSKQIIATPTTSYYDMIGSLKGVDITTSSLTFKTMSTRGFNGSGSARVNQFMDGMDNQAPGLNFPVGGFIGLTELDVENVELLPGAGSALFGPGGMNGTILVNSKNPFKYEGLSFQIKQGIMNVDQKQRDKTSLFTDWSFRWAKQLGNRFAFKVGAQFIQAKDWLANNPSNYDRPNNKVKTGDRVTDPNYDGVNVYGDETSVDLRNFMAAVLPANHPLLQNPMPVSRTGYDEKDVVNPNTTNVKLSGALHYKLTDKIEASLSGYWGTGNTVYTGSNRYALKGIKVGQYKLELKHKNWFLRGYTTQEDAGESYSATVTSQIFNENWKPSYNPANASGSWYPQYTQAFLTALNSGASMINAHSAARGFADQGRPVAGSDQFKQLFDKARSVPIPAGGLFTDKSDLWMAEGQYNFSEKIKFVDILVGANWKQYVLNSNGTIFIDTAGKININEVGAYAQISKKILNDRLTLSASGRYDKNSNFEGRLTPRFTALVKLATNHNLRLSYQTAYRFPTTQQQYIKLNIGGGVKLLGGLPWIVDYMRSGTVPCYVLVNGVPDLTKAWKYNELKPESVQSFEVGYKGLIKDRVLIDVYSYWGTYTNFLGRTTLVQPTSATTKNIYSIVTNSSSEVKTYGFGASVDYRLPNNFSINANVFSDKIDNIPAGFSASFNAPELRYNIGFANSGFGKSKRVGFNVQYRWQKDFLYESDFAQGPVASFGTLDMQVCYKFPYIKSIIKIGGTNVSNSYYLNAYGNPEAGAIYYASFAFNVF
jgi:outer membrane receptor protein involved in Fe transport